MVALVAWSAAALAQLNRTDVVKYISENKLYRNGGEVTVTRLNLEWPLAYDGNTMDELQGELCKDVLGINSTNMREAWTEFHRQLGKETTTMPDSVSHRYIDANIKLLWFEKGRYVSLYVTRQTRNESQEVSSVKKFVTYDLVNDKILKRDDVFRNFDESEYGRVPFETLIEQNAVCEEADKPSIDLTILPTDFAILGANAVFGLGGPVDHENFSTMSLNTLYQLGELRSSFVRWVNGKTSKKNKKNDKSTVVPIIDFDTSLSSYPVVNDSVADASFPDGNQALTKFMSENIHYPESLREANVRGRVVVQFIVDTDGSLSDLTVIKPLHPAIDREVIRVLRLMPRWNPATKDGKTVRTSMVLPVSFRE